MKQVEIKFRGLSPSGKWVYGYYVERDGYDKGMIYDRSGLVTDVDPKTVGQFIGLTDKNGTPIFKGDILNTNYSLNSRIVSPYYVASSLPFIELLNENGNSYDNGDFYEGSDIQSHNWEKFEILGNIYQNSELLVQPTK